MRKIWTVARQTLIQSTRSRLIAVFVPALVGLIVLTSVAAGQTTPSDHVQAFLAYSVALSSLLLSVLTILLGCGLLCGEITGRQIFAPVTKPIARWQYLVGRWLGIVALQAALVAAAGVAIYALAHAIRYQAKEPRARRLLDTEVFSARARIQPMAASEDLYSLIDTRRDELKKQGRYDDAVAELGQMEIEGQILSWAIEQLNQRQTALPLRGLAWRFTGLPSPRPGAEIQFCFTAKTTQDPPGNMLHGQWIFGGQGFYYTRPGRANTVATFPADIQTTFTLPYQLIGQDGRLNVAYQNVNPLDPRATFPASVTVKPESMFLLYPIGRFGPNFLRAVLLVLCLQVFLAALAILAGSWLSFPVACLWCFVLYGMGMMSSFLTESTTKGPGGIVQTVGYYASRGVLSVLPDFAVVRPADMLVKGLLIPWSQVLEATATFAGVWTVAALGLGCVLFTRRELARVIAE